MPLLFKKFIGSLLLVIAGWNICLSIAEDTLRFEETEIASEQSSKKIDQHPCHSQNSQNSEHHHICHLGHCRILYSESIMLLQKPQTSLEANSTKYRSMLLSFMDLFRLFRPPI